MDDRTIQSTRKNKCEIIHHWRECYCSCLILIDLRHVNWDVCRKGSAKRIPVVLHSVFISVDLYSDFASNLSRLNGCHAWEYGKCNIYVTGQFWMHYTLYPHCSVLHHRGCTELNTQPPPWQIPSGFRKFSQDLGGCGLNLQNIVLFSSKTRNRNEIVIFS